MTKVAIPVFGERISSRLDCAVNIQLTEIDNNRIIKQETIKMFANNPLEKINTLLRMNPDTVICDGITEMYINKLALNNINIIPWVQGNTNEILNKFINDDFDGNNRNIISKQ